MMFQQVKTRELKTVELAGLVRRAQDFTRGSYTLYDRNYDALSTLCKRIMQLSKQTGEWYVYFSAIYEFLYLNKRQSNYREIVRYAEIYYRDSALYMDKEIPNYPDTDMPLMNIYIYTLIFEAYCEYYQIDDDKMEAFMQQYELAVQKYGRQYDYYKDELFLTLLYRDTDRAETAAHRFLEHEGEIESCYVCTLFPYLAYLLMTVDDIRRMSRGGWVIFLIASDSVHDENIHFITAIQKKLNAGDSTVIDRETFDKLYSKVSSDMKETFDLKSECDTRYLPVGKKNVAMRIGAGKDCNAFTLRLDWGIAAFDDRNIAIAHALAREIASVITPEDAGIIDPSWKEAGVGY